jgi:multidrug resistance efflux pump
MAQGGSSVADLEKQLAELQAKQKEYRQNYSNVVGSSSEYDTADYNYAVLQFRRKYGPDNYFDRIRAAQQQLEAARKAAATPPPAAKPPATKPKPPAAKPPATKPKPPAA